MARTVMNSADKIIEALKMRLGEESDDGQLALAVESARVMLLCYCNIPLNAEMPQGLYEAWKIAAENAACGNMGNVASISEGDVSISFKKDVSGSGELGWKTIADRFKRMAV